MIWRLPQIWFSSVKTSKFSIDFVFCFSSSLVKREISSFLISFYFTSFLYNMIVLFLSETETLCSFNHLYIFLYLNIGCTHKSQTLYLWSHILMVSIFPFRVPFLPWGTNALSWYCHKSLAKYVIWVFLICSYKKCQDLQCWKSLVKKPRTVLMRNGTRCSVSAL